MSGLEPIDRRVTQADPRDATEAQETAQAGALTRAEVLRRGGWSWST